jgi:hypothetical protein
MRRSRWNASISRETLRKPPGGSASSTRCGKSCSFAKPVISRLRRVISPNPPSRIFHLEPVGQACPCMGLTQPSKATVIFWTADLRVTASARIVLVMIRASRHWSWQVPARRGPTPTGRGAYAIRALPDLCAGIVSGGLGTQVPQASPLLGTTESPGCVRGSLFRPPGICHLWLKALIASPASKRACAIRL